MKMWIVGQHKEVGKTGNVWEVQGVFDSEAKAIEACRTTWYFIIPLELNENLPHETIKDIPGAYYPAQTGAKQYYKNGWEVKDIGFEKEKQVDCDFVEIEPRYVTETNDADEIHAKILQNVKVDK